MKATKKKKTADTGIGTSTWTPGYCLAFLDNNYDLITFGDVEIRRIGSTRLAPPKGAIFTSLDDCLAFARSEKFAHYAPDRIAVLAVSTLQDQPTMRVDQIEGFLADFDMKEAA